MPHGITRPQCFKHIPMILSSSWESPFRQCLTLIHRTNSLTKMSLYITMLILSRPQTIWGCSLDNQVELSEWATACFKHCSGDIPQVSGLRGYINTDLGNGLEPNRQQAVTSISVDQNLMPNGLTRSQFRDHSGYGLSQWETQLHCNEISLAEPKPRMIHAMNKAETCRAPRCKQITITNFHQEYEVDQSLPEKKKTSLLVNWAF